MKKENYNLTNTTNLIKEELRDVKIATPIYDIIPYKSNLSTRINGVCSIHIYPCAQPHNNAEKMTSFVGIYDDTNLRLYYSELPKKHIISYIPSETELCQDKSTIMIFSDGANIDVVDDTIVITSLS